MIKEILVPVDFSEEAENALFYAAEIAKRKSTPLTILHAQSNPENLSLDQQQLTYLQTKVQNRFGSELSCETHLTGDNLLSALGQANKDPKSTIIVMGTKGASGLKKLLIGSNTVNVLASSKSPVLVIPGTARFEDFNKTGKNRVVLATDLEETQNEAGYNVLSEILELMIQPKLRILNVRPKNTTLNPSQQLQRSALLSGFGEEVETERITVFSSNVMNGINFYLDKNSDTGMIVMIARDSGGLFQKHFTREMASITHFPLLILKE